MQRALVGYTGFVGQNLDEPGRFAYRFNSRNFMNMRGMAFDEVWCAGVSAQKWIANQSPDQDRAAIEALIEVLHTVNARQFTLISTIDVYPDPSSALDEEFDPSGLENHAYGRNRLELENWVRKRFEDHLVVRLPALFGPHLKKNVLYDLLNSNATDRIDPAAEFQWYGVQDLWDDWNIARSAKLPLINLFTAPIPVSSILKNFFPGAITGSPTSSPVRYRLRTRHARLFGGTNGYVANANQILGKIGAYVTAERAKRKVQP